LAQQKQQTIPKKRLIDRSLLECESIALFRSAIRREADNSDCYGNGIIEGSSPESSSLSSSLPSELSPLFSTTSTSTSSESEKE
jgi:hypothetical protein